MHAAAAHSSGASSFFNSGSSVFSASSISCVASVPRSTESEPLVSPEFVLGFGFALIAGAPSLLGFVFLASVRSSGSTSFFFSGLIFELLPLVRRWPGRASGDPQVGRQVSNRSSRRSRFTSLSGFGLTLQVVANPLGFG